MDDLLLEYLKHTYSDTGFKHSEPCGQGPVITLSREFGCPSKLIAQMLTEVLNKRSAKTPRWRTISKEVVEESARRLDRNTNDVQYLMSSGNKGIIEDILSSFSLTYVSSVRLRKTITTVVRMFAQQGHIVLVGRGSVGILHGCPNTLHVRLMAPISWRVEEISTRNRITQLEATKMATEMDQKRASLIELMTGAKPDATLFDVIYNCSTLSNEEIVAAMVSMLVERKLI